MYFKIAAAAGLLALSALTAEASTLSFALTNTLGSDSSDTSVVLTDVSGGVKFSYTVSDALNTADIVAVYMDFVGGLPAGWGGTYPTTTGWSYVPSSGIITGFGFDTKNVAVGNINGDGGAQKLFDLGLAIGHTGSGVDFFSSFEFTLLAVGLDVTDFLGQTFAVRGQTVGAPPGGDGSSKEWGTAPSKVDEDSQVGLVPVPAALPMLMGALGIFGMIGWWRARQASA